MQVFKIRYTPYMKTNPYIMSNVPYRKGFNMFDEKFVCHRNIKGGNLRVVSHFKSGIAIAFAKTYKEVIEKAKNLLLQNCGDREGFIKVLNDFAKTNNIETININ